MKKFLALILALCMVFALCACGSSSAPAATEAPAADAPAEAPAESTGWAPDGPVTMIVAYKAGNGTDVTARILAQYAEKYVGQTIVIENVDGGSGSIGWTQLANAEPDGMTIGFMNLPNFNSSIVKELGDYTTADFTAICNHVTETSLVIVRADDDRFADIDALVAYAKENNTVASTNGAQASNHIGAQAFARSADFTYTDLPQGNTADELASLLGKEADWCVAKAADIVGRTDVKVL
ncbi:MAG: tripartite tricarboxylate transporter substrate binding protein, partial [Oscillospiraceae bacterium]|nr:tripartite tricarboxylate transporter substrate binding protein [Oscillospiraceae bacterium]